MKQNLLLKIKFADLKLKPDWLSWTPTILFKKIMDLPRVADTLVSGIDILGKEYALINKTNNGYQVAFSFEEQISFLLNQEYVKRSVPLISKLPFHYHKIPFRIFINKFLVNRKKRSLKNLFPSWPKDVSVDILLYLRNSLSKRRFQAWPKNKKYAVIFSHDVDTREGIRYLYTFIEIENSYGFKSTNFVTGDFLSLKGDLLKNILSEGHEIGFHGDTHDAVLPYLSVKKIRGRIDKFKSLIQKYNIIGFRAPSLLMSDNLMEVLPEYFKYDSSITDSELFLPDSDYSGSCTVFPFINKSLLRIPITVPMDSSLIFLGYSKDQILEIWLKNIDVVKRVGGLAMIVTHSEKHFSANPQMLDIYKRLVTRIKDDSSAWVTTGREIYNYVQNQKNVTKIN